MAICPKCNKEAGCTCSWLTGSDGVKCCQSCFAANQTHYNSQEQQVVMQPNNVEIQIQSITYQHNYTG